MPFDSYLLSGVVNKLYLLGDYSDFLFKFRSLKSLESEFVSRLELSYIGEQSSVVSVSLVGNVAARDKDFIDALCEEAVNGIKKIFINFFTKKRTINLIIL